MTAFIVSFECINKCVEAMSRPEDSARIKTWSGRELLSMNARAVKSRNGLEQKTLPNWEAYDYRPMRASKVEMLKALECLLVQCAQGDVMEELLYKRLEDVIFDMRGDIIHSLPEYREAPWG